MDIITVPLAHFEFGFRRLTWKDEFNLKTNGLDERRVLLATALMEVSGLKIQGFDDAHRLMAALPDPILHRVFVIYKGKHPDTQHFTTSGLYRAPEPLAYRRQVEAHGEDVEVQSDKVVKQMESTFGKKELDEAAEVDRAILKGSRLRGAIPKFADEDQNPLGGHGKSVKPHAK